MQLFDISTTVDPSYIISLIRKLLPPSASSSINAHEVDACDSSIQGSKAQGTEEGALSESGNEVLNSQDNEYEAMDTVTEFVEIDVQDVREDRSCHQDKQDVTLAGEEAWEEYGCVLWDLAASKTHAELMVLVLISHYIALRYLIFICFKYQ